ncbi:hypothetical protein HRI_001635400 [Hibiscus trionum]|uniref:Endonuclease/exonuclease/phosphatase domain-containing protein n=1 Tax=Hibiscus trionum TaxID=183268 RepID=A0A9W7HM79_HIBTR|nr:hypothetical protein HRI_001635400 [Hibiscus trionum]
MNAICSWNIRGIRKLEKKRALKQCILKNKPKMLFVQETKVEELSKGEVKNLWHGTQFEFSLSPAVRSAGGLLSVWDSNWINVSDIVVKQRFIAVFGFLSSEGEEFGFVNVYGASVDSEKPAYIEELLAFLKSRRVIWVVGGDFNLFLDTDEKMGLTVNYNLISLFRDFISEAGLVDIQLIGGNIHGETIETPRRS